MKLVLSILVTVLFALMLWPDAPVVQVQASSENVVQPAKLKTPSNNTGVHQTIIAQPIPPANSVPESMKEWLALRYASNPPLHKAMLQLATGWAQAIHDAHDEASAYQAGENIARAIACVMSPSVLESSGQDQQWAYDQIITARAEMLSKPAHSDAYIRFQELAGGQFFSDPGPSACEPSKGNT